MPTSWTEEDKKRVLVLNSSGLSGSQISHLTGVPTTTLHRWLKNPDTKVGNRVFWSPTEIDLLKGMYPRSPKNEILERLKGRTWNQVENKANKLKLRRETYKCILDFTNIDTAEKAYILGFIGADGCVYRKGNSLVLEINIGTKDRGLLERLRDLLLPTSNIYEKPPKTKKHQGQCQLVISDTKCCSMLMEHGIVLRKSKVLRPPDKLPKSLQHHYIRGYFDGDGSIGISTDRRRNPPSKRLVCSLAGTKHVLRFIDDCFFGFYQHQASVREGKGCFDLKFGGTTAVRFCQYMYTDAAFYMNRKYSIAREFI